MNYYVVRQKNEEQRVKISHFEGVISGLIESDKNQLGGWWIDGWIDGWLDGWMDRWMDG